MTVDFLVMAETALLDVTGCVSIVRIGHTAQVHQFPGQQVLTVVAQITGERTEVGGHLLNVRLLDAENVEFWEAANPFEIPEPKSGHLYAGFCALIKSVLTFPHAGAYRLEARVDGVLQRTTRLMAIQLPQEAGDATA